MKFMMLQMSICFLLMTGCATQQPTLSSTSSVTTGALIGADLGPGSAITSQRSEDKAQRAEAAAAKLEAEADRLEETARKLDALAEKLKAQQAAKPKKGKNQKLSVE